ncbi:MAG TPA: DUF2103 domain-containing protein [Symbiobacteriaceae bacterium]|jgi:hypothetical protein
MKFRVGKIKREHTVIEKLWPYLEQMAAGDCIVSIIPGPISPLNAKAFEITFQRFTETGLRLLAKNGSAVQEVYVVAPDKAAALQWLADEGLVDWEPPPPPPRPKPAGGPVAVKTVVVPKDTACTTCGRAILAGARAVRLGQKNYYYVHVRCVK